MGTKYYWNMAGTRCVKATAIREFTVQNNSITGEGRFSVHAWLNNSDSIKIYHADNKPACQAYINDAVKEL
jgi:hypothetical protein